MWGAGVGEAEGEESSYGTERTRRRGPEEERIVSRKKTNVFSRGDSSEKELELTGLTAR